MRRALRIEPSAVLPSRPAILLRAGVPAGRKPSARVADLAVKATELYLRLAEPTGLLEELSLEELLELHRDGRSGDEPSVLERVAPQGGRLALFAATLGEPVCARIRTLFEEGDAPLGFLLDAVASEAASALAEELGDAFLDGDAAKGLAVLGYSPGYCGWSVAGQRPLFARLAPGEIGISLGPGSLMSPVKSVSGVLVAAPPSAHRVGPGSGFCEPCADRTCLSRAAALRPLPEAQPEGGTPWTS